MAKLIEINILVPFTKKILDMADFSVYSNKRIYSKTSLQQYLKAINPMIIIFCSPSESAYNNIMKYSPLTSITISTSNFIGSLTFVLLRFH